MTEVSRSEIRDYVFEKWGDSKFEGDFQSTLSGFCSLNYPKDNCLMWIKNAVKVTELSLNEVSTGVIISQKRVPVVSGNISWIIASNPKTVFFGLLDRFFSTQIERKIEEDAVIETESIGKNVAIGHHSYISPYVSIGDNTVIGHNVTIIGRVSIGQDCLIHSGAVLGAEAQAFSFEDGVPIKAGQHGGLQIGDKVEIGSNTVVERGTIDDTIIKNNVKLSSNVQVSHNAIIEDNVVMICHSIANGSSHIKEGTYIAPGGIIKNQTTVEDGSFVGMGVVVNKDTPKNSVIIGSEPRVLKGPVLRYGIKL